MLYTIGHSNHPWERFIELIEEHSIEILVDVRSAPYSRYSPHFNKEALEKNLPTHGVKYIFLGQELGGRPENADLYDTKGYALYDRFAKQHFFQNGITRLLQLINGKQNLVLLCSEANPNECHRKLLIAWYLYKMENIDSFHIHADGRLERESEFQKLESLSLFEDDPEEVGSHRRSVKKIAGYYPSSLQVLTLYPISCTGYNPKHVRESKITHRMAAPAGKSHASNGCFAFL